MGHPARIPCAKRLLVKKPCFAGAVEIARRPVACEHSWINGCGTQPTALCSHEVSIPYIYIYWEIYIYTRNQAFPLPWFASRRPPLHGPVAASRLALPTGAQTPDLQPAGTRGRRWRLLLSSLAAPAPRPRARVPRHAAVPATPRPLGARGSGRRCAPRSASSGLARRCLHLRPPPFGVRHVQRFRAPERTWPGAPATAPRARPPTGSPRGASPISRSSCATGVAGAHPNSKLDTAAAGDGHRLGQLPFWPSRRRISASTWGERERRYASGSNRSTSTGKASAW